MNLLKIREFSFDFPRVYRKLRSKTIFTFRRMLSPVKKHFEINELGQSQPNGEDFSMCWWRKEKITLPKWLSHRTLLLLYLFAIFLYVTIAWLLQDDLQKGDEPKLLGYLYNWMYVLDFSTFLWGVTGSVLNYVKQPTELQQNEKPSQLDKFFYFLSVLNTITAVGAFCIGAYDNSEIFPITAANSILHVTNATFMALDYFTVTFPHSLYNGLLILHSNLREKWKKRSERPNPLVRLGQNRVRDVFLDRFLTYGNTGFSFFLFWSLFAQIVDKDEIYK